MRTKIVRMVKHPLVSGSSVVFFGTFFANFINYLFNLLMGRALHVTEYGLFITFTSLLAIFGIFQTTLVNVFAKNAAVTSANNDKESYNELIVYGSRIVFGIAIAIFLFLGINNTSIMSYLHIHDTFSSFLMYGTICLTIIFSLSYGVFQGKMMFVRLSIINPLQPILKLVLGLLFIYLGFHVFGAVLGLFLSTLIVTGGMTYLLRKTIISGVIIQKKKEKVFYNSFLKLGGTFFLASIGITLLSTIDVILVKHYFSSIEAGQYAALSLMGKAIFYLTSPIAFVFFPLIAYKKEKKEPIIGTLLLGMGLVAAVSFALALFYSFFPFVVLKVFFPAASYQKLSLSLGFYAFYISIFSLGSLLSNFFLSIGKTGVYKITLFFACTQIIGIMYFHSTLSQVITILFYNALLLLMSLFIYYLRHARD